MIKNMTLIFLGGQKNVAFFVLKTVWMTRSLTPCYILRNKGPLTGVVYFVHMIAIFPINTQYHRYV